MLWLFIASLLVLISTQVVAQLAWHSPSYDVTFNNISDLGNVYCQPWSEDHRYVCSPRHVVANAGFLVAGLLFLVGVAATRSLWRPTRLGKIAHLFLFGGGLLWLTAGLWPADVNEGMHLTGWLWLLLAEAGMMLSYAGLRPVVPKAFRVVAPLVGIGGVVLAFAFLGQQYFGLGRGTAERLVVYSVALWSAALAVWMLIARRSDQDRE